MKRAELIIGKSYYYSKRTEWITEHYGITNSIPKTAERLKQYRVVVIETQLKTEYERNYHNRDVLIQKESGTQVWVPLNHLKIEWATAVKQLTEYHRERKGYDDPANRYARHLARKHEREKLRPALKEFYDLMEQVMDERVWDSTRLEHLNYETIVKLNSLLKTQTICPFCGVSPTLGCPTCEQAGRLKSELAVA